MTARQLPERPNVEQLKRQAKDLLHAARTHDADALVRFRVLPALARVSDDELARAPLALHDAQSVIARELGFASWNALRDQVEESTLEFRAAADQFVEAATDGRPDRAERLLALYPGIARASLHTALVLGDAEFVDAQLNRDPSLATGAGGPRGWAPLHYVCYTSVGARTPERERGLVTTARRLIAVGANPNLRFPWRHHAVFRPVLWGAVSVTRSLALARVLLDAGANPSDGVTLTIAASSGDLPALELLEEYGVDVNAPWATDGSTSLYALLAWSRTSEGALWLIAHGADPNAVFAGNGDTPLHAVARGWDVALAEALAAHGADVTRRSGDGRTPYAVAALNGNRAVAEWLAAHGGAGEGDLSEVDRLTAACARGDLDTALALVRARPSLPSELTDEHYEALHRAAERGDVAALVAMMACGFDPNRPDPSIGKTALHSASGAGQPDAVRVLLRHGASVEARDHEFHGQPLVWAAEGSRAHPEHGDYRAVARALLDAGSPTDWEAGSEPAEAITEILEGWRAT